ncbi:hypothetical protein STRDD11_00833 [Streptococcus sp. DD11]|uniref:hypothetical protein n=1 Tax=Streptococcus sp. DD11 TaxID=1777879 RepID=UPI000799AFAA|nr:hypothetical protein [Streptococcus sp. DD11]KXT84710.1 hypothetical protein STRDD11_00833 [Streptococcus sp. DD11]
MKKILLILAALLLLPWTVQLRAADAASEQAAPAVKANNYTIKVLTENLKDSSQEEIDQFFEGLSDDTRICADKTGGFVYRSQDAPQVNPNQPDAAVSTNQAGQEQVHDINGPDSATVKEVKEALESLKS